MSRSTRITRSGLTALLAATTFLAAACGSEDQPTSASLTDGAAATGDPAAATTADAVTFPTTVTNCGDEVEIATEPTAILTVGTTAVNVLAALDRADLVVARSGEFGSGLRGDADAAAGDAPVVTDEDPTLEQIIGSGADLVVGYGLFNTTPEDLAAAGISSLVVSGDCGHDGGEEVVTGFDNVWADLDLFGSLLGATGEAETVRADLEERLAAVEDALPEPADGGEPPTAASVYFFGDALSINGNRSFVHAQLEAIGVRNVFDDLDEAFVEGSREELIARDPDVIVLAHGLNGDTFEEARATFLAVEGVDAMRAVRENRIVGIPSVLRDAEPAGIEGVELLADEIYETS